MNHPRQGTLLDYAAGNLSQEDRAAVAQHLEKCEACRNVVEPLLALDPVLDQWQIDSDRPPIDIWPAVSKEVAPTHESDAIAGTLPWYHWRQPAMRLAASIALAATVGHLAGRGINAWRSPTPHQTTALAPSDEDSQMTLSQAVEIFGVGSPAGLADILLGDDEQPDAPATETKS